jgi:hypothetical protein
MSLIWRSHWNEILGKCQQVAFVPGAEAGPSEGVKHRHRKCSWCGIHLLGSNHFAFLSLAVRVGSGFEPTVRFLGASPLGAPTTSVSATASTPPHRPIELFAYSYLDCCRCAPPLLPLRSSVTPHALYDRRQSLPPAYHGLNAFF